MNKSDLIKFSKFIAGIFGATIAIILGALLLIWLALCIGKVFGVFGFFLTASAIAGALLYWAKDLYE